MDPYSVPRLKSENFVLLKYDKKPDFPFTGQISKEIRRFHDKDCKVTDYPGINKAATLPQSTELIRGPLELVQHFRL
jgi:hypothetical protein